MLVFDVCAVLLLGLLGLTRTECGKLTDSILHYEGLSYATDPVHSEHQRVRRSLQPHQQQLNIHFKALNRDFNLVLKPDRSSFTDDFHEELNDKTIAKTDLSFLYKGTLAGNVYSKVYGSVLNGIFSGVIRTPDDVYHVEKSYLYFPRDDDDRRKKFHSIIYRESDVREPDNNGESSRMKRSAAGGILGHCGNDDIREWMRREQNLPVVEDPNNPKISVNVHTSHRSESSHANMYTSPSSSSGQQRNNRYKRATNTKLKVCPLYLQSDTMLWDHVSGVDSNGRPRNSPEETRNEILSIFSIHIQGIKDIYEPTVFVNTAGTKRYSGISFAVRRVKINKTDTDCPQGSSTPQSFNPYCNPYIDAGNFLNLNSLNNHTMYCLAYIFTYRDFSGGTLGLAWVGSPGKSSGGICEINKLYEEKGKVVYKSYNTGIVTFLNYGNKVATKVSILTFAHEVGHNFGSPHDSGDECTPYSSSKQNPNGNYIMFASATSGDKSNNRMFSPCSKSNISEVLHAVLNKESGKRNCFDESNVAYCGNGIVEEGEQCDCGYLGEDECERDKCCYGQTNDPSTACKLKPRSTCSVKDPCCKLDKVTQTCSQVPKSANKSCLSETECSLPTTCDGINANCPKPKPKANDTACNAQTQVCLGGECSGSICHTIPGWEECYIKVDPQKKNSAESCFVACQKKGTKNCISTKNPNLKTAAPDMQDLINKYKKGEAIQLPAGAPCNNYQGYCDVFHKCRGVDADGPLARLKNMIFNPQTLTEIKDWIEKYWWAVLIMSIVLVAGMAIFIKVCSVHTPSQNPKMKPAQKISLRNKHGRGAGGGGPQPHSSRAGAAASGGGGGGYPQEPPAPYGPAPPRGGPPPGKGKKRRDKYAHPSGTNIEMRNQRV
ncbi:disintegrin and metalloproteinase domain-containing protein 10-like isoform X2 [Tubulanus polymorphus]|uniref:disintegrin and metalloproteinase domain-containing protein 10-like isoform X2 n=1 Tax=Tubulanus polymorphus TaxID=672921 RepID=UPI003DA50EBE